MIILADKNGGMDIVCMTNTFCFIACVNDEELYKESLLYIKQLEIPPGFSIECRAVRNARSMTGGYNTAMRVSDAKYKIFMHQDVFILNKWFLFDLKDIFLSDATIGMVGVVGSADITAHGVWWESENTLGCAYDALAGVTELQDYRRNAGRYGEAKIVDGLLIATQYDLTWRDDMFDGWHLYDASQCCEFLRKNYKVFVADQYTNDGTPEPWCLHYIEKTASTAYYENYRNAFLTEYKELIFDNNDKASPDKYTGICIVLLVGDHLDDMWVRIDEIDKYMCKGSYELIIVVDHLDNIIQKLFEQEGIKTLFVKPDEGASGYLNRAVDMANKQYDIMLLDCRISISGSISLPMQHAVYGSDDIGAVYCTAGEPPPGLWAHSNKPESLLILYKRTVMDKTGSFDKQFKSFNYTIYDYTTALMNSGYKMLTRNITDDVFESNDSVHDLQADKIKFDKKWSCQGDGSPYNH